jgi:hypothetical protein
VHSMHVDRCLISNRCLKDGYIREVSCARKTQRVATRGAGTDSWGVFHLSQQP